MKKAEFNETDLSRDWIDKVLIDHDIDFVSDMNKSKWLFFYNNYEFNIRCYSNIISVVSVDVEGVQYLSTDIKDMFGHVDDDDIIVESEIISDKYISKIEFRYFYNKYFEIIHLLKESLFKMSHFPELSENSDYIDNQLSTIKKLGSHDR